MGTFKHFQHKRFRIIREESEVSIDVRAVKSRGVVASNILVIYLCDGDMVANLSLTEKEIDKISDAISSLSEN